MYIVYKYFLTILWCHFNLTNITCFVSIISLKNEKIMTAYFLGITYERRVYMFRS